MRAINPAIDLVLGAVICASCVAGCDDSPTDADADADADIDADADADADTDESDGDQSLAVVTAVDENNYSIVGTIDIPSITTASGTDLDICWDGLTEDIQCHAVSPVDDIDNIGLIRFGSLTQAEVEDRMSRGQLQQADMNGYLEFPTTGDLCTTLSAFTFFGTPIDVLNEYVADAGTYMLVFTTGTTPGIGARMITFLEPVEGETATAVDVGEGCGVVTVDADLASATPLVVPRTGPFTLDWSALTTDGQGGTMQLNRIDGILVAYYEGATVAELEGEILDLMLDATWLWPGGTVSGSAYDFVEGWGDGVGFDTYPEGEGTWLIGLTCSRCYNPAPLFLTVLQPGTP
jgi:hypothetical protein